MRVKTAFYLLIIIITSTAKELSAQLSIHFPASDGLEITADWYPVSSDMPVILLCHQNGFSRGEYSETALRLNKLGFNCLAIDQRVGNEVNGVLNETAKAARDKNLKVEFVDAEKDILAGIDYLFEKYKRDIIILGSSYSASLALKIAVSNDHISAVAAFSPGEYFSDKEYISKNIRQLTKPVFATSSKAEADGVTDLLKDVNSRIKVQYIPKTPGDHGSKVLWSSTPENQEYWIALMSFLNKVKNPDQTGSGQK
jgi:dienelactone hydrolase